MRPEFEGETVDARRDEPAASRTPDEHLYLLVLDGNTSAVYPLPHSGGLLIGRSPEAGVPIRDLSVSRQHAKVVLEDGEAQIVDLGSHNGVRLNGEPVTGSRALESGDVVMLGDVTLVFHCGERARPTRPLLGAAQLRSRLSEELERVLSYERALSVLALDPGANGASAAGLVAAAGDALRLIDFAGESGTSLVTVVLPELGPEEAAAAGEQLLERLRPLAPHARAGLSSAPMDGLNAEALLTAARTAALAAPQGGLLASEPASHRLTLGERSAVVADPAMVQLFELLRRLAATALPVLIHGETGSGKENAAWALHHWSARAGPFVPLNCASLPEGLADSELFGHERGAFSGADKARAGRLEESSGGTLFLDEVAELPLPIQAKLLRALEQKRVRRLGDSKEREVDLRVVAATHRVLADEVKAGRFREDLFFRLSGAVVMLPPLRDRPCELPLLINAFLAEACARQDRPPLQLSAAAMGELSANPWPGNVRELKNAMEYVAAVTSGPIVEPSHLPRRPSPPDQPAAPGEPEPPPASPSAEPPAGFRSLAEEVRELERRRMCEALAASGGVHTRAAKLIGMPLRTFAFKLKRYGISARDWQAAP